MSEKNDKPIDHGLIQLKGREQKSPAYIPHALKQLCADGGAIRTTATDEELIKRFGRRKLRALRPHGVRGVYVKIGDVFEVPGNTALELVSLGQAEFVDNRAVEEKRVLEEVKRLGLDKRPKIEPSEFQMPKEQDRSTWRNS